MPFTADPIQQGKYLNTRMIRVDANFAAAVKAEAETNGIKVTEVTRHLYEALYAKGPNALPLGATTSLTRRERKKHETKRLS